MSGYRSTSASSKLWEALSLGNLFEAWNPWGYSSLVLAEMYHHRFWKYTHTNIIFLEKGKKYTSGPRYWNIPVLVNTGTFLAYQCCLKMWYLHSLEHAGVIQKLTILVCKNGLVLSNTHVLVSGTWSICFPWNFWFFKIFFDENYTNCWKFLKWTHSYTKICNEKGVIDIAVHVADFDTNVCSTSLYPLLC